MKALTNEWFFNVRHRAPTNLSESRMSVIYFGAPSLLASISTSLEMLSSIGHFLYRTFTWARFKDNLYFWHLTEGHLDDFKNEWVFGRRWSWDHHISFHISAKKMSLGIRMILFIIQHHILFQFSIIKLCFIWIIVMVGVFTYFSELWSIWVT